VDSIGKRGTLAELGVQIAKLNMSSRDTIVFDNPMNGSVTSYCIAITVQ